jgi:hypothetical protein
MLKVETHIKKRIDEDNEPANELGEFKGIYYNDNHEQKYYEGGAHFKYKNLCGILEKIVMSLTPDRRGKSMYEDWEDDSKNSNKKIEGNTSNYYLLIYK